jgi:enoyl-CoA hydratase/carnithine racemase
MPFHRQESGATGEKSEVKNQDKKTEKYQDYAIQYCLSDSIGTVTLSRPEAKNAITRAMWKALPSVLANLQESGARVIILTGGGNVFSAGADLVELSQLNSYEEAESFWLAIRDCLRALEQFDLPLIAMINGACMGGGCLLANACDLRYASRSAKFAIPTARLGIILDDDSIMRLASIVGESYARQILLTGLTISSKEANHTGLVNGLFEDAQLNEEVMRIANLISSNNVASLSEVKKSFSRLQQLQQPAHVLSTAKEQQSEKRHHEKVQDRQNQDEQLRLIVESYLGRDLKKEN